MAVGKLLHPILHNPLLLLLHGIALVHVLQPLFQELIVEVLVIGGLVLDATRAHVQLAAPEVLLHLLVGLVHRQVLRLECRSGSCIHGILVLIRLGRYVPHIKITLPSILLSRRHVCRVISNSLLINVAGRGIYQLLPIGLLWHLYFGINIQNCQN